MHQEAWEIRSEPTPSFQIQQLKGFAVCFNALESTRVVAPEA